MKANILLSFIYRYFKMKIFSSKYKKKIEKIRKERITLFNKINNLSSNGANVYVIIEYNGKYSIYNSRSDKEWFSLEVILVNHIIFTFRKSILTALKRDIILFQNEISQMIFVEK
jgi:hypothetical protein